MCLAPTTRYYSRSTKTPASLSRKTKGWLPPRPKNLRGKPSSVEKREYGVEVKPRAIPFQSPPTVNPKLTHQSALKLKAIFRNTESFEDHHSVGTVALPSFERKEVMEWPHAIKRTSSFSSDGTPPTSNSSKKLGTLNLFIDTSLEDAKEEHEKEDNIFFHPGFSVEVCMTPPSMKAYPMSPPSRPRPSCYIAQEYSFPETLNLPDLD